MMAELIPTNSPFIFTRAPPEFPGFIDASVWMKSSYPLSLIPVLPSALTIPEVTVLPSPNGLPIAITKSPTSTASDSPIIISVRSFASTLSKAISVAGSEPITSASSVVSLIRDI